MIRIRHTPFLGQPGHLPHPLAASARHRDLRRERKDIPLRKQIRPEKEVSALSRVEVGRCYHIFVRELLFLGVQISWSLEKKK